MPPHKPLIKRELFNFINLLFKVRYIKYYIPNCPLISPHMPLIVFKAASPYVV